MKKIILFLFISSLLMNAGVWSRISGATAKTIKPRQFYAVDVSGENIRVYEWKSQMNSNVQCFAIFSSSKMQSGCFKVK